MRKVKIAYLHAGLSVPGISTDIGASLNPADPQSKIKGASLTWSAEGLEFYFRGRTVLIPTPNVKSVEFFPEEPKTYPSAA